jgi:dipeptidyl aminopeptidase/acylaminoacyl peptidase
MMRFTYAFALALLSVSTVVAQTPPPNLVVDGVPAISADIVKAGGAYTEARGANFADWRPGSNDMLITTRFGSTVQLHSLRGPGAARTQISFQSEPVPSGSWAPVKGDIILFAKDNGGDEYFQYYRMMPGAQPVMITDGKSRNQGAAWSRDGEKIAYTSTRRTSKDTDIYIMNPRDAKSDRMVLARSGGGWSVEDWSDDGKSLLIAEYVSINDSKFYLLDIATGKVQQVTENSKNLIAYGAGRLLKNKAIIAVSDRDSEWRRLVRIDPKSGAETPLIKDQKWDVEDFDLDPTESAIVFALNEDGYSKLYMHDLASGTTVALPALPNPGVIVGLKFHPQGGRIAFTLNSAKTPGDIYSLTLGTSLYVRWTESEVGPLDVASFRDPELMRWKSFDGREISAIVYRPDPKKFPGARPAIINIHGGPEGQSRPGFQSRSNYLINELGLTIIYPNVRGSEGYGKSYLKLDNGMKREDSVSDIGALITALGSDVQIDAARLGITGGSYGGYMTLAAMTHYSDKLKAGIEVVGISNFVTFLKNTNPYRVDLRRVEYGDERDPEMAKFLTKISPLTNVAKIKIPLMVVTGANDPRVPASEADQVVKAVREQGGSAWHVLGKDEGHGFRKKANIDYQFWASLLFWQQHLLK